MRVRFCQPHATHCRGYPTAKPLFAHKLNRA